MAVKAGEVEYIVRVNDDKVDENLDKVNKKIEKAAQKSADMVVKIEKEKAKQIQKESDKVVKSAEKSADNVAAAWKDAGKDAKKAMSNIASDEDVKINVTADTSDAKKAIRKISDNMDIHVDVKADISEAKTSIKGLEGVGGSAARGVGSEFEKAFGNISSVAKSSFSDAFGDALPITGKIGELTSGLGGTAKAAVGIGAVFADLGIKGVGVANDLQGAMNNYMAQTGKSKEETERYEGVLKDIYANNYGQSFEDISGAMANVTKNMGEMDDASLQNITESGLVLRDTFGYDLSQSTETAKIMMDNFGIAGEDAMNLIAAGAQTSMGDSQEYLDTISQYSGHFADIGLDADDMFKILQTGSENGALSLDSVGNAITELSTNAISGSEATREGFESIGLNADEMSAKFAAGGDTAKEAFEETMDALADMEDPMAQNAAGVELFGSSWDDLGPKAVTALADMEEGAFSAGDELEALKDINCDNLGEMFEGLSRALELLVLPLGEALMPLLMTLIETVLPIITELLTPLMEILGALIEPILNVVSTALEPLIGAFQFLMDSVLSPLIGFIQEYLMPVFEVVMEVISNIVGGSIQNIVDTFKSLIGSVKTILGGIIDFVKCIFKGDWEGAWNAIKDIFGGIWDGLKALVKAPINAVIGFINTLIEGLNKIKLPSWLGGKGINIPKIPKLKVGMDYVPGDDFPALLHEGEMVLTRKDADILRDLGGLDSVVAMLSGSSYERGAGAMNGIASGSGKKYYFTSVLELDGKTIAKATSQYTDTELANRENLTKRGVI